MTYTEAEARAIAARILATATRPTTDEVDEPLPYEPYASDGIEADHAADEGYWGPLRWGGVA